MCKNKKENEFSINNLPSGSFPSSFDIFCNFSTIEIPNEKIIEEKDVFIPTEDEENIINSFTLLFNKLNGKINIELENINQIIDYLIDDYKDEIFKILYEILISRYPLTENNTINLIKCFFQSNIQSKNIIYFMKLFIKKYV